MEPYIFLVLLFVLPVLLFIYQLKSKRSFKLPPGPKGLPIVGNIFNISPENAHLSYTELAKTYGDVMCVNMVGDAIVVLSSADAIREAFVSEETRDAFAGRPDNFYIQYCEPGPSTAFMNFCDVWKIQRKFLTKTLKVFENDEHNIQGTIQEQLSMAVEKIRETDGKPFYIKTVIVPTIANILLILIAGERFEFDDPALKAAMEFDEIDARMLTGQILNILTWFPFLRHLPFGYGKLYKEHQRCLNNYFHYFFDQPKKTFDVSKTRGFIDVLFGLQPNNKWLKDDNIKGILRETIGAGIGTSRGTLLTFFLVILHKPDVMRKIQEEIDRVIGRDRPPLLSDRHRMVYTEAAMMELLRHLTVAPLGAPHTTTRDVEFRNYFIPKDTQVIANLWAVHHDPAVWGDPWVFRPERFLDKDGHLVPVDGTARHNWFPFGVGRRSCLGENFARSRVFLLITTLLQNFDFLSCADEALPSFDPSGFQTGITIHPPTYRLRATPRK